MNDAPDRPVMLSDLLSLTTELKTDIAVEGEKGRRYADGLAESLRTELESDIAVEGEKSRRHMNVVAERLRADLKVVIDKTTTTDKKLDRLITSNAIEHAAILDAITDHEVRVAALERTDASSA